MTAQISPADALQSSYERWFRRHVTPVEGCAINAILWSLCALGAFINIETPWWIRSVVFAILWAFSALWLYMIFRNPNTGAA